MNDKIIFYHIKELSILLVTNTYNLFLKKVVIYLK